MLIYQKIKGIDREEYPKARLLESRRTVEARQTQSEKVAREPSR